MFFGLTAIADHPCCRMQEVVEGFFLQSIDNQLFTMDLFPDWVRPTLAQSRCVLGAEFKNVHALLHAQDKTRSFRQAVYDQLCLTNRIHGLCDGTESLPTEMIDWGSSLGKAISGLMLKLYESLDLAVFRRAKTGNVRPTHELYREFVQLNKHICPFCGLSRFKNPRGIRREDFDHYLHKSAFPFAAANTKNLVPTCGTCNQDYKKNKNILGGGAAFYPYSAIPPVELKIECTAYPEPGDFSDRGCWNITLTSSDPAALQKMSAWERVYSISDRLRHEVLECFEAWMEELGDNQDREVDEHQFVKLLSLAKNSADIACKRRVEPGQIIKAAFYEFMLTTARADFVESFRTAMNASII